jgi:YHS domain-containing protein
MTKNVGFAAFLMLFSMVVIGLFATPPAAYADCQCCPSLQNSNGTTMAKDPGTPSPAADKVILRKAKADEIGKKAVCPVMGESLTVTKDTDVAEYRGKTYFFCCSMCPPKFKAAPEKYVKK